MLADLTPEALRELQAADLPPEEALGRAEQVKQDLNVEGKDAETGEASTILVSRSGGWVAPSQHGERVFSLQTGDRFYMDMYWRQPWWWLNDRAEERLRKQQDILNKHGLTPKHR